MPSVATIGAQEGRWIRVSVKDPVLIVAGLDGKLFAHVCSALHYEYNRVSPIEITTDGYYPLLDFTGLQPGDIAWLRIDSKLATPTLVCSITRRKVA